jgi:ssDNA-binding Zn-finger/Zn-ribbon topoisomerase 1
MNLMINNKKEIKGYRCPECKKGILMTLNGTIGILYCACNKCNTYFYSPPKINKKSKLVCWKCNEIDGKVRGKIYNLNYYRIYEK